MFKVWKKKKISLAKLKSNQNGQYLEKMLCEVCVLTLNSFYEISIQKRESLL